MISLAKTLADDNVNKRLVISAAERFLEANGIPEKDVSIAIVGDAKMKSLNAEYRKINATTDILAFPGEDGQLGELVINYRQIERQAKRFGNNAQQELIFILVHGLLHLLGYKDDTKMQKQHMMELGEEFIKKHL